MGKSINFTYDYECYIFFMDSKRTPDPIKSWALVKKHNIFQLRPN